MKKIYWILMLAVVLRVVLALTTYHSDVQPFDVAGYVLSKGYVLSYYDFLPRLAPDDPILKAYPSNLFNYPPAVYLTLGFFSLIFTSPINHDFHMKFLFDVSHAVWDQQIFLHLLLLKLPYFFVDAGAAWFVYKLFDKSKYQMKAVIFWLFNPVNLYATYMMGQFDIIPVMLVLAALWVLKFKKTWLRLSSISMAALLLGLGAAYKIYPLLFLIPLASTTGKFWERVKVCVYGVLVYVAFILPFLPSKGFRTTALLAGQTMKSLYAQIPISGGESIIIYLALLVFFYLYFWQNQILVKNLWERFFIMMLLFFGLTHYHPQWFLWITPFFIFDLLENNYKNLVVTVVSFVSFLSLVFLFESGLNIALFSPLFPGTYDSPTIWQIIHLNIDINFMRSLFQTVFVGCMIYWMHFYMSKKQVED